LTAMRWICRALVTVVLLSEAACFSIAADTPPEALVLIPDLPRASDLAAAPGGQSVACVDDATGAIIVVEPRDPRGKRVAVDAPAAGQPRPVAVGFIDDTVLAAVCQAGAEWSLCTWRLRGNAAVESTAMLQSVPLARCDEDRVDVHLVISHLRGWLAVIGLEPEVVRAPIAGVHVGRITTRHCPQMRAGSRVVAATLGPENELVVCTADAAAEAAGTVAYYGVDGRRLLDLDTGLRGIRDAAFAADGSALYVVAGEAREPEQPAGLWRLDGGLKDGRQVIRPRLIASLADPVAVACPTPRSIIVTQGTPDRTVVQIEPEDEP